MDVCVKCHENPCECHRDARPRGFLDGPPPPEALPSHIVDRTTSELCKQNRYLIEEVGRLHEQNKQLLILLARVEWIMDQETGKMDGFSQYFCDVAHARAEAIQNRVKSLK